MTFDEAIETHNDLIYKIAHKYKNSFPYLEYDDIMQELYTELHKKIHHFKSGRGALSTFLTFILENRLKTLIRDNKSVSTHSLDNIIDDNNTFLDTIEDDTHISIECVNDIMVARAIDVLHTMDRGAVTIDLYVNGLTQEEISKKYCRTQQWVSIINKNNINKLREVFNI